MRIHLLSDLHLEFHSFIPPQVGADVVVLAGDIHSKGRSIQWALDAFSVPIIFVAGNHDFYGIEIDSAQKKFSQAAAGSGGRLHYLERRSVVIDGVRFLGATGWTDFRFGGNAPLAKFDAGRQMNDYRKIRKGPAYRRMRPDDTELIAGETLLWLERELSAPFDGNTVLITHHPVTAQSSDPSHTPKLLDAAYYNNWDHLFFEPFHPPCLALHGHTHFAVDYQVDCTRVVSNPRGYPGEKIGFNPGLVIDL